MAVRYIYDCFKIVVHTYKCQMFARGLLIYCHFSRQSVALVLHSFVAGKRQPQKYFVSLRWIIRHGK